MKSKMYTIISTVNNYKFMPGDKNFETQGNRNTKDGVAKDVERMKVLNQEEAMELVTEAGPNINSHYDITHEPWFPEGRTDVAIIQRDAEDGSGYGRTKWYVAYDNGKGVRIEQLSDTGEIHDNCHTWSVEVINGVLTAKVGYGGNEGILERDLSHLGLK